MTTTNPFPGFPAGGTTVPLPASMLTQVVPQIQDAAELLVMLFATAAAQRQRRFPRLVEIDALRSERALIESLSSLLPQEDVDTAFRRGLDAAVARGTLLAVEAVPLGRGADAAEQGQARVLLALNTEPDRRSVERARHGDVVGSIAWKLLPVATAAVARTGNAYTMYESAIGPITPAIAAQLAEAEGLYPLAWIAEAFAEAEELNRRSWRYVKRILERWDREGRDDAASGRDSRWRPDSRFEHLIRR